MFKLTDDYTYDWPVTIHVPAAGGKKEPHQVTIVYRALAQAEFEQLSREMIGAEPADAEGATLDLFVRIVAGWGKDICDELGAPLSYTRENLAALIARPYVRRAVLQGYIESVNGAASKN
ncbi:MAG: hypothetical protein AB7P52_17805 [Alphaproteobacteria bacterium]